MFTEKDRLDNLDCRFQIADFRFQKLRILETFVKNGKKKNFIKIRQ